jgi:hypothetical protein
MTNTGKPSDSFGSSLRMDLRFENVPRPGSASGRFVELFLNSPRELSPRSSITGTGSSNPSCSGKQAQTPGTGSRLLWRGPGQRDRQRPLNPPEFWLADLTRSGDSPARYMGHVCPPANNRGAQSIHSGSRGRSTVPAIGANRCRVARMQYQGRFPDARKIGLRSSFSIESLSTGVSFHDASRVSHVRICSIVGDGKIRSNPRYVKTAITGNHQRTVANEGQSNQH